MVTLFSFGKNFGVQDPSPFVLKVDLYLRMAGIEYQTIASAQNLQKAPKGKLPFIEHRADGEQKTIADSSFILEYLNKEYDIDFDQHLSDEQKALAQLLTTSLEENFYWCVVYSRWKQDDTWPLLKKAFFDSMPIPLRWIVPIVARKQVVGSLQRQGLGRHSHAEMLSIAEKTLHNISALLGDKPYFFGDKISSFDIILYAFMAQLTLVSIDNPLNQQARGFDNIVAYCQRIHHEYYPELG